MRAESKLAIHNSELAEHDAHDTVESPSEYTAIDDEKLHRRWLDIGLSASVYKQCLLVPTMCWNVAEPCQGHRTTVRPYDVRRTRGTTYNVRQYDMVTHAE